MDASLTNKANEVFSRSDIKTVGDLIRKNRDVLPGIEKFPDGMRQHTLAPEDKFFLPPFYWGAAANGIPFETLLTLSDKIAEFKFGVIGEALKALGRDESEARSVIEKSFQKYQIKKR